MKRLQRKAFCAGTALALLTIFLPGCGSKREASKDSGSGIPAARVLVRTAESKVRTMTEEVVGTVRAKLHVTVEAKLNGRIEKMAVGLGDKVSEGQLIAQLDAGEVAARLDQAEASLDQAERDWKRISGLFEHQGVTRSEYDAAQARLRISKGSVAEARARMGYVQIVAPFAGVVAKKWADVGDLAVPGKPLVEIEDLSGLQLDADVPEAIAGRIGRDAQLEIRVDSVAGPVMGRVAEIAPSADSLSRTLRVKLDLPPTPGLMPGQFARLILPIGESSSLRVPASAVLRRGQLEIVFVAADQRARLRLVKTGRLIDDDVEILSGLDAGDAVVVTNVAQLTDGQAVTLE
jgi:RND family efflux transporter MFP subunit